ncbi:MAG: sigma-70 family RNA polymerase sigma factor [Myxococcales bacterium]|nr:sigma-70 family RNA polymerase sigma factor [Myxococcales bacterium]
MGPTLMELSLSLAWPHPEASVTDAPIDLDAALVARAQRGDGAAFEQLVRRHQRGLWRLARRYVRSDADAADVTQQAFVRAYQALGNFRGDASVRSWLYRIAINLALNTVRDRGREQPSEIADDALTVAATGADRLERGQRAAALRAAIAQLPPKQKLVLELRVFDELAFREVAALADCTENAAKVSFHFAVKRLRALLGDEVLP